jgi:hypothetical protein
MVLGSTQTDGCLAMLETHGGVQTYGVQTPGIFVKWTYVVRAFIFSELRLNLVEQRTTYKGRQIVESTHHHASSVKIVAFNGDIRTHFRMTGKFN